MKDVSLLRALETYGRSDAYPLHMPGHKRQISHFTHPFSIDITEIDGFDNLFHAEGILLEAQRRAARLFGAEETYYLINGSTCGILSAVAASVKRNGRILMARNCHKAAYHAVFLNGLQVTYLYPGEDARRGIAGCIRPEAVQRELELHPDTAAVLITSPTYDGVVSDVRRIAELTHRAGAILIVDAAHGAHFGMAPCFPESPVSCGADLVINSIHKTLPSLTQTALLHVGGSLVDREKLRKYLGIYQSSSPSYVLMAAIDSCVRLLETRGGELFGAFARRLESLRTSLEGMKALHLVSGQEAELDAYDYDRSRVVISTEDSRTDGPALSLRLRQKYRMEAEMEALGYMTAILTIADTQEGFDRLEQALLELDTELASPSCKGEESPGSFRNPSMTGGMWDPKEAILTITEAEGCAGRRIPLKDSPGQISGEYVYLYPPGIPALVPGERIPEDFPERLRAWQAAGLNLQGLGDYSGKTIRTVIHS